MNSLLIKQKAVELGFADCGIVPIDNFSAEHRILTESIEKKYHATMLFLQKNMEKRLNPKILLEEAKSFIVVIYNYLTHNTEQKSKYKISKYALSTDYHIVIKEKLNILAQYITENTTDMKYKTFVDTMPIFEKSLAQRAGLGWIGKNTLLITKNGSYFNIGGIICNLKLDYDSQQTHDACGQCSRCIDKCPTHALTQPYILNANKCFAYQSIENKEDIDYIFTANFKNQIYGCDICQDVCPWNSKAKPNLTANSKILNMTDDDFENLTQEKFDTLFKGNVIKRVKFNKLKKIVCTQSQI